MQLIQDFAVQQTTINPHSHWLNRAEVEIWDGVLRNNLLQL